MNRIERKFMDLRRAGKKALIVYLMAGDPSLGRTEQFIHAFEKEGVDLIELGVPFSDPLADGPVIQEASRRSLAGKTTLAKVLRTVRRVRKRSKLPILLMSYFNPVLQMGLQNFVRQALRAGVDGLIVPDLPPDEERTVKPLFRRHGLDLVYLLAPTSTAARRKMITRASRGFVYYVSLTGVTGARKSLSPDLRKNIRLAKKNTRRPVCVGFGVSTPQQARKAAGAADGVIIGSAIVKAIRQNPHLPAARFARKFIRPIRSAMKRQG